MGRISNLHAADALIVGVSIAVLARSRWLKLLGAVWPARVAFALVVTANHFWLNIAVGAVVACAAGAFVLAMHTKTSLPGTAPVRQTRSRISTFRRLRAAADRRQSRAMSTRGGRRSWSQRSN